MEADKIPATKAMKAFAPKTKVNEACSSAGTDSHPQTESTVKSSSALVEGEDYYSEGAVIVFTAHYHLRRGYCCESGCRHCPYEETTARDQALT